MYRAIAKFTTLPNVQPAHIRRADGTMPWVTATARFKGVVGMNTETVHAATASTMMRGAREGFAADHSCTTAAIASDMRTQQQQEQGFVAVFQRLV